MLVLTRADGEEIMIGDDIVVTIVQSSKGKCRVGVTAPREVTVHRSEVVYSGAPVSSNRARRVEQVSYLYVSPESAVPAEGA